MIGEACPQNKDQLFIATQKVNKEDRLSSDTQIVIDESHNFSAIMAPIVAINKVQCEESGMEKEIIKAQPNNLRSEAVISRILHEHPKLRSSPKLKSNIVSNRDAWIDKAANRLKLAREHREQQAVAKKTLPRVQRNVVAKSQNERKENNAMKSSTGNQKNDAELASGIVNY